MKIRLNKFEKRDCKEQKRLTEIEIEKLALEIDKEFLELKVEEFIKDLGKPLCDRCIFKVFELQKQTILNDKLKNINIIELKGGGVFFDSIYHRKAENKLFNKLVLDTTKQCTFCLSKYFILAKQNFFTKNCEILMEKIYKIQKKKQRKLLFIKILKIISFVNLYLLFCYFLRFFNK